MKIYHYTTLEKLVLILKNRTIRFNRLDQLDDPCERHFFSLSLNWSPYTYVSCWTENSEENIPQWHMYSKGGIGIRIGFTYSGRYPFTFSGDIRSLSGMMAQS